MRQTGTYGVFTTTALTVDATAAKRVAMENNFIVVVCDGRFDEGEEEGGRSLTGSQSDSIYSINMPPIAEEIAETPETPLTPSLVPHACLARRLSQSFVTVRRTMASGQRRVMFIFIPCSLEDDLSQAVRMLVNAKVR